MIMNKRLYVSLPIDSIPDVDINERIAYANHIKEVMLHFYEEVVTPFDGDWREGLCRHEYLRMGFKALLCCDAIYMCKGYEKSDGCSKELALALWSGLEVKFEGDEKEREKV